MMGRTKLPRVILLAISSSLWMLALCISGGHAQCAAHAYLDSACPSGDVQELILPDVTDNAYCDGPFCPLENVAPDVQLDIKQTVRLLL